MSACYTSSDLCHYSDAYIVVNGAVIVADPNSNTKISKINNTLTDNAEDLDIGMPMYNLVEYSKIYSKTSGTLWNYYRDESNRGAVRSISYSIRGSKSFDHKTSITGRLHGSKTEKEVEIVVPLKDFSNF